MDKNESIILGIVVLVIVGLLAWWLLKPDPNKPDLGKMTLSWD